MTTTTPTLQHLGDLAELAGWEGPVASVYLPIDRGHPAKELLSQLHSASTEIRHAIAERTGWNDPTVHAFTAALDSIDPVPLLGAPGVVIFLAANRAVQFVPPETPGHLVEVGSQPVMLPLLPWFTDRSTWWLLSLSQSQVRLWHADRRGLTPVELHGAPQSIGETAGTGRHTPGLNRGGSGMMHGTGNDRDLHKTDLRRHLHAVDEALAAKLAGSSDPLVVAAVEYEAAMFIAETRYRHVVTHPLTGNAEHLDERSLHRRSRELAVAGGHDQAAAAAGRLHAIEGNGRVATWANRVSAAFERGQVGELLVARSLGTTEGVRGTGQDAGEVTDAVFAAVAGHVPITLVDDADLPKGAAMAALLRF